MSDQFRISPEILEEEVGDALAASSIDPDNPGFTSLLAVMRGAKEGTVDRSVQVAYFHGLGIQIGQAKASLEQFQIPAEIADRIGPALAATAGMVGDMEEALAHFGDWLAGGKMLCLERAIALLEAIHGEIRSTAG
jgi:hypothetical protein